MRTLRHLSGGSQKKGLKILCRSLFLFFCSWVILFFRVSFVVGSRAKGEPETDLDEMSWGEGRYLAARLRRVAFVLLDVVVFSSLA